MRTDNRDGTTDPEHQQRDHEHEHERKHEHDHEQSSPAESMRDEAQEEQLRAQSLGDTGAEIGAFFKEVAADHAQFPGDVVEDNKNPERRVDEEQGVPEHPSAEPARDPAGEG